MWNLLLLKRVFVFMQYIIKNTIKITFLDFHKNIVKEKHF